MDYALKNLKNCGINSNNSIFIIAEIGINHNGDLNLAKKLIESAKRAGADAVKFQTYITEKRVSKESPVFDILKKCELPFEAFKMLQKYAERHDIIFFSTAFDEESLEYLKNIDCDLYKISSFEVANLQFLKKFAQLQKSLMLSVGMANLEEVKMAYDILSSNNNKIALLHCVSAYPTEEEHSNLGAIFTLKQHFDCLIGHSDHTNDIVVPFCAAAAGAQILEKHYRIDEKMDCADAPVSITEKQMRILVGQVRRLERILGNGKVDMTDVQKSALIFRKYAK